MQTTQIKQKAETQQGRVQKFLAAGDYSPYFFSNRKTQAAVDFRVCPLMKKNVKGIYESPVCPSCYSKNVLNVYRPVANRIEKLPEQTPETLEQFEETCIALKEKFGWEKIRFYALSDFGPEDIPYIHVAGKYFMVDIISKSLIFSQNEKYLVSLFDIENVSISLSFNKQNLHSINKIEELLRVYEPQNVNLNYTLKYPEENPSNPEYQVFSIIHMRNQNKRKVMKETGIEESRICCILDINGDPVDGHGHCTSCDNCHTSYINRVFNENI